MRAQSLYLLAAAVVTVPTSALHAQVSLSMQWLYPVETIYAADFSPYLVGQHPDLLGVTLLNGSPGDQPVVLELSAAMVQPDAYQVFVGSTDPFVLSGTSRRLTNRDLASRGRDVSLIHYDVADRADGLGQQVSYTGRLPSGSYVFTGVVRTPTGAELDRAEVRLDISNPSRIELLAPGLPFGDPPPVLASPAPRFTWGTDAGIQTGSGTYTLRVARADGATSAEEAMQGFAVWEHTTTLTAAQYPASVEAVKLEPGASYAWQVVREVRTSGGVDRLESPIYTFRMDQAASTSSTTSTRTGNSDADRLTELLVSSLGLGAELQGFRPSGPLMVNGRAVSLDALGELLRAISAGEIRLRSLVIR